MNEAASTRKQGRPARISRQDVAEAALAIGLDTVTLATVAERLGVDHSSLYRHILNRDDMVVAAVDHAVGSVVWAMPKEDWRTYLADVAREAWDLYMRHPGLAEAIRRHSTTPMAIIVAFSRICRQLEAFGFTADDAVLIVDSIMDMTCDSAAGWLWVNQAGEENGTVGDSMRRSWQEAASAQHDLNRHATAMTKIISGDPEDWWRRKLEILLDGAAARI